MSLRELPLKPWAACRREDLLGLLACWTAGRKAGRGGAAAAEEHAQARLLMTQPGVGPNTALAFVLTIGGCEPLRGQAGGQLSGTDSARGSSGGRQKLGAITKQGNRLLRRCWWKRRRFGGAL